MFFCIEMDFIEINGNSQQCSGDTKYMNNFKITIIKCAIQ